MCLAPLAHLGGRVRAHEAAQVAAGAGAAQCSPGAGADRIGRLAAWGAGGPELRPGRSGAGAYAQSPPGARHQPVSQRQLDHILVHRVAYYAGLHRVNAPEWRRRPRPFAACARCDRHHGADPRLERAARVWASYHNFEPAQWRSERQRHYTCTARKCRCRHPGLSPRQVAGAPPGKSSARDAVGGSTPTEPLPGPETGVEPQVEKPGAPSQRNHSPTPPQIRSRVVVHQNHNSRTHESP